MTRRLTVVPPHRCAVDEVTLLLPVPPSVNALHSHGRGRLIRSDVYRAWIESAGWRLVAQRPGRVPGPYMLLIAVPEGQTKADLDNLSKATSDLLQAHGVIDNDRKARRVVLDWHSEHDAMAVTVRAVPPDLALPLIAPTQPRPDAREAA